MFISFCLAPSSRRVETLGLFRGRNLRRRAAAIMPANWMCGQIEWLDSKHRPARRLSAKFTKPAAFLLAPADAPSFCELRAREPQEPATKLEP
jgi:hypothetical protein